MANANGAERARMSRIKAKGDKATPAERLLLEAYQRGRTSRSTRYAPLQLVPPPPPEISPAPAPLAGPAVVASPLPSSATSGAVAPVPGEPPPIALVGATPAAAPAPATVVTEAGRAKAMKLGAYLAGELGIPPELLAEVWLPSAERVLSRVNTSVPERLDVPVLLAPIAAVALKRFSAKSPAAKSPEKKASNVEVADKPPDASAVLVPVEAPTGSPAWWAPI